MNKEQMTLIFSKYFKYLLLAVLISFPIFGHLGALPIRIWDEARLAINAYEMYNNGDYIVTSYKGTPDMWNTKPPLLIWIQVIFMKFFGVNEAAIRLPSAIAAFLTCMTLMVFSLKYLKNFWFGFIAIFILITSNGYIEIHGTRTGDYDALLTLFTTLGGLIFFSYCETKNNKQLYLFFLFTALAVLTKSIAGMLFLPAILIYAVIKKQVIPLLKNKHFYIGSLSFILLIVGYYLLRETYNPGFITAVQQNELGGRFNKVIEEHNHGFWYYYDNFINSKLSYWFLLIPCGVFTGFFIKNKRIKQITLFSSLMAITFFLVISSAQTKLTWYDLPLYPFLAIIIAVFIYYIFNLLRNIKAFKEALSINVIPFIFLYLVLITPYQEIFNKTYKPKEVHHNIEFYEIGYYLKDAVKGIHELNNQYLLYDGYGAQNLFYINLLKDQGVNIDFKDWTHLKPEDVVFTHQEQIKEYLSNNYKTEVIHQQGNIITYKIFGRYEQ